MIDGKALIFSAPSGAGKTTIVKHLVRTIPTLRFSISATTRPKREGEVEGKDYYFISLEEFRKRIGEGEFLEWEEVYQGTLYGTLKSEIDRIWSEGHHVIFDVDVEGGVNLKKQLGDQALACFVKVSDLETLKHRLVQRNSETPESLEKRVLKAQKEMRYESQFDQVVVNDRIEDALNFAMTLSREFLKT